MASENLPEVNLDELNDRALMLRIAQELGSLRRLVTDAVQYAREAESEIPEFMRRFMDYAHDIHDIKYMYEELGHSAPDYIRYELERCDDRMRQLLTRLHEEGGSFAKIRREMAEDPNNRWDHTRAIAGPKKETNGETGTGK
jgi:hypothetical protein